MPGAGAVHHIKTGKAQIEQMFSGSLQLADISEPCRHFRVVPNTGLVHRNKQRLYSMTSSTSSDGISRQTDRRGISVCTSLHRDGHTENPIHVTV